MRLLLNDSLSMQIFNDFYILSVRNYCFFYLVKAELDVLLCSNPIFSFTSPIRTRRWFQWRGSIPFTKNLGCLTSISHFISRIKQRSFCCLGGHFACIVSEAFKAANHFTDRARFNVSRLPLTRRNGRQVFVFGQKFENVRQSDRWSASRPVKHLTKNFFKWFYKAHT